MPIEIACDCGQRLKVQDQAAGKKVKCPACGIVVQVPVRRCPADPPLPVPPKGDAKGQSHPDASLDFLQGVQRSSHRLSSAPLTRKRPTGRRFPATPVVWGGIGVVVLLLAVLLYLMIPALKGSGFPELIMDLGGGVKMEFVLIPAGEFMMGSADSDSTEPCEKPQHGIRITKPFYLGKYEVTQEQWRAVMGSTAEVLPQLGPRHPIVLTPWARCQDFVLKMNEKFGGGGGRFSLPTEAQWEYACRAGTRTPYSFGDSPSDGFSWAGQPVAKAAEILNRVSVYELGDDKGRPLTIRHTVEASSKFALDQAKKIADLIHPVGQKKPNAWGLYDMYGNATEWCADWYAADYYSKSPAQDPAGPDLGEKRVYRGGFSVYLPRGDDYPGRVVVESSASRGGCPPGCVVGPCGLRVARAFSP